MDGVGIALALQVAVNLFGDERREGSRDLGELNKNVTQSPVRRKLVAVVRRFPEAAAAAADIPVGQVFNKLDERADGLLKIVIVHRVRNLGDQSLHRGDDPPVEYVLRLGESDFLVMEAVDVRVSYEERIGVPPRNEQIAHQLLYAVFGELKRLRLDDGRINHIKTDRVGAVRVEHQIGIGIVLETLRHLLAVFSENKPVNNDVLIGRLVEKTGSENHERIEPAARLIETLGDEVRRKELVDTLPACIFPHIMLLGIGHRAGLEPAVENFGRTVISLTVFLNNDLINEMLVEIRNLLAGKFLKLLDGADADHIFGILVVDPHGDAAAPEAVARNIPIASLFKPVAETLLADVIGSPVHRRIVLGETLVEIFDADVPGIDRSVDKRRIGTIAERIRVNDCRLMDELALGLEPLDEILVAILAEAPLKLRNRVGECARVIKRIDERRHARFLADAEVVFAVCGSDMNETYTVISRDVIVVRYAERTLGLLIGEVRENRFVLDTLKLRALKFSDNLTIAFLFKDMLEPRLGHNIDALSLIRQIPDGDVIDRCAGADHKVLWERPGSRRPDEKINRLLGSEKRFHRFTRSGKRLGTHRHRRILDILVVITGLKIGKRS